LEYEIEAEEVYHLERIAKEKDKIIERNEYKK